MSIHYDLLTQGSRASATPCMCQLVQQWLWDINSRPIVEANRTYIYTDSSSCACTFRVKCTHATCRPCTSSMLFITTNMQTDPVKCICTAFPATYYVACHTYSANWTDQDVWHTRCVPAGGAMTMCMTADLMQDKRLNATMTWHPGCKQGLLQHCSWPIFWGNWCSCWRIECAS